MLQYGKRKRGSAKLHPHNECDICSECKPPSKKRSREIARREIEVETANKNDWFVKDDKLRFVVEQIDIDYSEAK